jgi:YegS/Rv2252/BmrU family lipid kinase
VIFNPAARGEKARRFRRHLDTIGTQCVLQATTAPGDARRLAAEAVGEGFDLVVAAGGDGTVNEVLNGIGDAPAGFERARLGLLPLGTVNVFARELNFPLHPERAWQILRQGNETRIDLPRVAFSANGVRQQRCFAQLAGAGFDARAIELVDWAHKKKIGLLAYLIAGLKALRERQPKITVRATGQNVVGEFVLVGNGRFYGGPVPAFPQADLRDGLLDICVLPRLNGWTLLRCAPGLLTNRKPPAGVVQFMQAAGFELAGETQTAFELDGEWVGHLPATFSIERARLRVIVP